jgi:hypothetical protein
MDVMGDTSPLMLLGGVVILILLAVGVFVGVLVYLGRSSSKKSAGAAPRASGSPPRPREAGPEQETAAGAPSSVAPPPWALSETPARPGEVMRVIRDERTARIVVEVEGQSYTHIREIQDAQVGRRVLWAIADLIRFTGGMAANPQAVRSLSEEATAEGQAAPLPEPGPAPQVETPPAEPSPPSRVEPPPPAPAAPGGAQSQARSQVALSQAESGRYNMVDFFRRGFAPPPAEHFAAPTSFIDEIEAILQAAIQRRATPLPYEVHVTTGPNNALQIEVGRETYASPAEVPDPEARKMIQAAVAEWESRY